MAEEKDTPETEAPKKKKSKLPLVLLVLLLLAAGGGGVAYKMLVLDKAADGEIAEGAEPKKADPIYIELRPAFVVNLADQDASRFVQLEVDLMSRLADAPMYIETHMPAIRHQVVMDLSSRGYAELRTVEGKQSALDMIRDRINQILLENTGQEDVIEEVYFSSFVMQ